MSASLSLAGFEIATAEAALASAAALVALPRQGELALPAKLVLAPTARRAGLRVEILTAASHRRTGRAAGAIEPRRVLVAAHAALSTSGSVPPVAELLPVAAREALTVAGWKLEPSGGGASAPVALAATPPWGGQSRLTLTLFASEWLRVTAPDGALRASHEDADIAVGLFALQANARLRLARASVRTSSESRFVVTCDATVRIAELPDEGAVAAIERAAAAATVARRLTLASFRVLAGSIDVARAYLASDTRFADFRSISTATTPPATAALNDPEEEDESCRLQPQA